LLCGKLKTKLRPDTGRFAGRQRQRYSRCHEVLSGLGVAGSSGSRLLSIGAGFFVTGIVLFSGSLYLLVLTPMSWPGPITPVGGVCLMVGWALLITAGIKHSRQT
jgi:uncharacterized membrane protein YgdD (TMEM256/DUF423 family)